MRVCTCFRHRVCPHTIDARRVTPRTTCALRLKKPARRATARSIPTIRRAGISARVSLATIPIRPSHRRTLLRATVALVIKAPRPTAPSMAAPPASSAMRRTRSCWTPRTEPYARAVIRSNSARSPEFRAMLPARAVTAACRIDRRAYRRDARAATLRPTPPLRPVTNNARTVTNHTAARWVRVARAAMPSNIARHQLDIALVRTAMKNTPARAYKEPRAPRATQAKPPRRTDRSQAAAATSATLRMGRRGPRSHPRAAPATKVPSFPGYIA
jgi:hypothetical protein